MQTAQRHFMLWSIILGGSFYFLYLIKGVLLPFVLGVVIAYFFNPACSWLEKRRFGRSASAALIILSFFILCAVLLTALIPVLYQQTISLMNIVPTYIQDIQKDIAPQIKSYVHQFNAMGGADAAKEAATNLSGEISAVIKNILGGLLQSGSAIITLISVCVITPMVGFYLLRDWEKLCDKADNLLPRKHAATIREQLAIINHTIAGFVRGQLYMCLIIAVYYTIALSIIDLNFAFALGILAGVLLIVPMVGTLTSAAICLAVAWFQFTTMEGLVHVAAVFAIGMLIDNILTPKLVGSKVGLHPVWIIFGMFCGGALLGFVGVLLAIPLTAVIGVLVRFSIQRYISSPLYQD